MWLSAPVAVAGALIPLTKKPMKRKSAKAPVPHAAAGIIAGHAARFGKISPAAHR